MNAAPANTALAPISNAKTILLTTYKRDGTPVATPVSLAFDGERAFFRRSGQQIDAFANGSWKTKGTAVEYRPQDCTDDYPPI